MYKAQLVLRAGILILISAGGLCGAVGISPEPMLPEMIVRGIVCDALAMLLALVYNRVDCVDKSRKAIKKDRLTGIRAIRNSNRHHTTTKKTNCQEKFCKRTSRGDKREV